MTSGIYQIRNLVNENRYVGSSKDLDYRKKGHFHELNNNKYYNNRFQKALKGKNIQKSI